MKYTITPYVDPDAEYWDNIKAQDAKNLEKLQKATKKVRRTAKVKSDAAMRNQEYVKTMPGICISLSNQIKSSDRRRKLNSIRWETNTFRDWLMNNEDFQNIFNTWTSSNHATSFKPTIQRVDTSRGYHINNMKVVMSKDKRYEK